MKALKFIPPLIACLLLFAAFVPATISANSNPPKPPKPAKVGDPPAQLMYLDRIGKDLVLTQAVDSHKNGDHVDVQLNSNDKKVDPTQYQLIGTWDAAPATELTRVINIGTAQLWLSTEGHGDENNPGDKDNNKDDKNPNNGNFSVQFLTEVLKNGVRATYAESGCVVLQKNPTTPVSLDVPAPYPAITLNPGDVLSLRVSVRLGSAIGCQGASKGKVRLEYGNSKTPSQIDFTFGGSGPAATNSFNFVGSYVIANGVPYITPTTVIESTLYSDPTLLSCTTTLTFPSGLQVVEPGCAGGDLQITSIPASDPALGTYTLQLTAVPPSGGTRSDILEFYCVNVLPTP